MNSTEAGEGTAVPSPDDETPDLMAALEESLHEARAHQLFQQQHSGMTEAHPLYAELFDDWRAEIGGAA